MASFAGTYERCTLNRESEVAEVLVEPTLVPQLGSDTPQRLPSEDAFGYAPFARALAAAAGSTPSPQGLVMAVDGPWGAGKTTLLNFIKHYLVERADDVGAVPSVIVDLNPWWFSDREQLARQFLAQFRAQFPSENKLLMTAADALATYADAIGTAVSVSLAGGTGFKVPLLGPAIAWGLRQLKLPPKDIARLKADVSTALSASAQRFVVFVDDIDRLMPDEIREVFKVIKALADFPNVVYVLAFDRHVVSRALGASLGPENGHAYLDKIVQAQFALPAVDHDLLVQKFIDDLQKLYGEVDDDSFSATYWGNVFHDGLAPLLQRPRDVVRIINALSVTFPALRGEVNPVDFIALEFLRVFMPTVYATIRESRDRFIGGAVREASREQDRAFHDQWLSRLDAAQREPVQAMLKRIFPRLQYVWSNTYYGPENVRRWTSEARVCSPEMVDVYFQFSVPLGQLSRAEFRSFIELSDDVDALEHAWSAAVDDRRTNGGTRADQLIARLNERDDLGVGFARACLKAFYRVGDRLLVSAGNEPPGFYVAPLAWRICWLVSHLAKRLPEEEREALFCQLTREAAALGVVCHIVNGIDHAKRPEREERDSIFYALSAECVNAMRAEVVARLRRAAENGQLIVMPDFYFLLRLWHDWGRPDEVKTWFAREIADDASLLRLLGHALQVGSSQTLGDRVVRRVLSIDPRNLARYLPDTMSIEDIAARVRVVSARVAVTDDQAVSIREFARGMDALRRDAKVAPYGD
jgi:predicted KAP-like P-loop ATPase